MSGIFGVITFFPSLNPSFNLTPQLLTDLLDQNRTTQVAQVAGPLPSSLGWYTVPDTKISTVCAATNGFPSTSPSGNCNNVTVAWNGAIFDTLRNRLVVFGGGHGDYYGNELYTVSLETLSVARLTDPAIPVAGVGECPQALAGGTQPNSVHTYDGIEYIESLDKMYLIGGAKARCGNFTNNTWHFDFATNLWEVVVATGTIPASTTFATAYDPNTERVIVYDRTHVFTYSPTTSTYVRRSPYNFRNIYQNAVIDPVHQKFVSIGRNEAWIVDISSTTNWAISALVTTGGDSIISADYPGLDFDPVTETIVGWAGGDTVYSLDLDTNEWTSHTYTGGPGAAFAQGTHGRWRYSPTNDVFIYLGAVSSDVSVFRLNPTTTPDETDPTISVTNPTNNSTSSATTSITVDAADNIAVVGVQFYLDGAVLGDEDVASPFTYDWDTTSVVDGSYTLTARARDAAGNTATSSAIVTVVDNDVALVPIPVGTLIHDGPATPEQLALYLPVTGSLSQTATTSVRYREVGDVSWTTGHPLYRIQPNLSNTPPVGTVDDAFAWTIIDLTPDTSYEIEVTVASGTQSEVRTATMTTRDLPPAAGAPNKTIAAGSSQSAIQTVLNSLVPGDVLEIADGTYNITTLQLSVSGATDTPIYIRGQSREGTILRATSSPRAIQLLASGYLVIENLTLEGSNVDSGTSATARGIDFWNGAPPQRQVTIRNVTLDGFDRGILTNQSAVQLLVYDNTLIGNNEWTTAFIDTNLTWNDDGINAAGYGNAVFNNTLQGFGDCLAAAVSGYVSSGVHFYRNDIRSTGDDFFEADYGHRNITFYDNRVHNSATTLSLDPLYGGPLLFARNISINTTRSPFKFNNTNSGFFLYNNTIIKSRSTAGSHASYGWLQNNNGALNSWGFRNNIYLYHATGSVFLMSATGHNPVDFTHNSWYPDGAMQWPTGGSFASLALVTAGLSPTSPVFSGITQRHYEDNVTVQNPWVTPVTLGATYATEVTDTYRPTLADGTAPKNSGVVIAGITDGYSGALPDRGAVIAGRTLASLGDRTNVVDPDPDPDPEPEPEPDPEPDPIPVPSGTTTVIERIRSSSISTRLPQKRLDVLRRPVQNTPPGVQGTSPSPQKNISPRNISGSTGDTQPAQGAQNSIAESIRRIPLRDYQFSIRDYATVQTRGESVRKIQQALNALGFTVATEGPGSKGNETDFFGPATERALKAFQKRYNIVTTGSPTETGFGALGPATREAINKLIPNTVTETQNTETSVQTDSTASDITSGGNSTPSTERFPRQMEAGMRGEDVRQLQIFLNSHGFPIAESGSGSPGNESEFFGEATRQALIRFQETYREDILVPANMETAIGFFGPSTIRKINQILNAETR